MNFFAKSEKKRIKSCQEKNSELKKRGKPKTGHCEGAMITVIWTLEIITLQEKANFHHHNDQDENVRTSTTVQVIRTPKY